MVMALGGEPVGPRYIDWNFVSSSKDRINQARDDWRAGRMKLPDLDNGEFIRPLWWVQLPRPDLLHRSACAASCCSIFLLLDHAPVAGELLRIEL